MRNLLAALIAVVALLLFMPQEVSATADNDAVDVTSEYLQPALTAEAVERALSLVLVVELLAETPAASQESSVFGTTATVLFAEDPHTVRDARSLLLDHRWTLRSQTGHIAAGIQ